MTQDQPLFDRKDLLTSLIIIVMILMLSGGMGVYVLADKGIKDAFSFAAVCLKIEELNLQGVDADQMLNSARRAMFNRLDRYSRYMERRDFEQMDEEMSGSYYGIGVTVVNHELGLMIVEVREGGPAHKVYLLSGDIVIKADTVTLAEISATASTDLLRGEEGTNVLVTVYRPATSDTLEFEVTRGEVPLMHIPFAGFTPDSLVYIRLLNFESGASADLEAALDSLLVDSRGEKRRGLILDLRGNPGGLFSEARKTADLFLSDGIPIVGTDGRSRWNSKRYYASGSDLTGGLPMAVLVDGGSASSSEIVAGALQQAGRAILVGDTTFGKGLVQGFVRFPDGDGLRLTISRYYVGDSLYLNSFDSTLNDTGRGLAPDYPFDFVDRERFPAALSRSLLLLQFAGLNRDEIIEDSQEGRLNEKWIHRLAQYTEDEGFTYSSNRTEEARLFLALTIIENSGPGLVTAARRFLDLSIGQDRELFDHFGDYIKSRLKELAIMSRYGTSRAYAEVIVPEKPVISYAAKLLAESL